MTDRAVVVGVDYGSLSGRAVVARASDGQVLGQAAADYPHAVMDEHLPDGTELGAGWALQHPADYVHVLRTAVPAALAAAGVEASDVVGIGTDFTACTVMPTTADGTPLCLLPEWESRPHAWVKLWKHHAAQPQADRLNALARERCETWLPRYGGKISSEWEFPKALQVLDEDREVWDATACWVEAADWIVWQLCGNYVRNACTAGYKGIYQDGAYPDADFCAALDPDFADFVTTRLGAPVADLGGRAGNLSAQAAAWTGLPEGIAVAVGNVDAHVTAPAVGACDPGHMVAIMGTSTCHVVSGEELHQAPGMCGVVDGGIVPGLWGYEAGQSGVGDILAWFTRTCVPAAYTAEAEKRGISVHTLLSELGADQAVGAHGLVALDWNSGNRSTLVDHDLTGLILGQTLTTRPEEIYRALVEATAFGTRTIVEALRTAGVPVDRFTAAGGLTHNPHLMRIYADVLDVPIHVAATDQAPALGSAMHAAVAAGYHADIRAASDAMAPAPADTIHPDPEAVKAYEPLYRFYTHLYDHFGRANADIMHALTDLRRAAGNGGEA